MMCDIDKNQLFDNLKVFIVEQKAWLQNTLNSVGWSISDLETLTKRDEPDFVSCCINSEHRVPPKNIINHESKCEIKNGDYPKVTDIPNLEVKLDEKNTIRSIDNCDDESNNILDVIDNAAENKNEDKLKSSTCLKELLAAERDAKRRRAAHRGKRVHSNKKSYVEVLREVISSQMETLHDESNTIKEFGITEAESTQKTIIQPNFDLYLGVGSKCYSGNPYKRWKNIEEEEQELIKEIQTVTDKKHRDRDRSRESYNEKNAKAYDCDTRMQYSKHREQVKNNEGYRGSHKSGDDRYYHHSVRNDERNSSFRYNYEKYARNKSDMDDTKNKDVHSDSRRSSDKHKKKSKKHSRELSDDSNNSFDTHKKKRKKKSRERSTHKKKHRKSKYHRDSDTE